MTPNTKSVYIGMALTHAPKAFRAIHPVLVDAFEKYGYEVFKFVGLEGKTEPEVYTYDRSCTEEADLAIFICDHPSIGLGMEITFRFFMGKPMLIFFQKESHITRMLTGFMEVESIEHHHYQSVEDIVSKTTIFLDSY